MCVAVTLMPGSTLTDDEVFKMGTANGDGVGVAWARDGQVQWYKTCKYRVEYITHMLNTHINYPRLCHFRYATVGGTRPDLCHPFEVSPQARCEPVGTGKLVMMHNGHFGRWKELLEIMEKENLLPDKGPWSDTRLIAHLASQDLDWLNILGGRVALLDGDGQFRHMGDWSDLREGVRVSNLSWNHEGGFKRGGYSGYRSWPGWEFETEAEWEAWLKAQEDEKEARREAIDRALKQGAHAETKPGKQENRGKEEKVSTSGTGNSKGAHDATDRHVRETNRVGNGGSPWSGGPGPVGGQGLGTVRSLPTGRSVSQEPWQNPVTRKWYKADQVGHVVEVPAPVVQAGPGGAGGRAGGVAGRGDGKGGEGRQEEEGTQYLEYDVGGEG